MTKKDALQQHKNQHLMKKVGFEIALEQLKGVDENRVVSKERIPAKGFLRGVKNEEIREIKVKDLREKLRHQIELEQSIINVIDAMLMR